MASTPSFISSPKIGIGICTVAEVGRSGAVTNTVLVYTAGASGSRIDRIDVMESAANAHVTSVNTVSLWIYTGTTYYLFREVAMLLPPTPNAGVAGFQTSLTFPFGLNLQSGYSLRASIRVSASDSVNVIAYGGDL